MNGKARQSCESRLQILRLIREGGYSRAELARRLSFSRAAVSMIVDRLIASGLVSEGACERGTRGRAPILLSLRPSGAYAVGINLRRDRLALGIFDLCGSAILQREYPHTLGKEAVLDSIAELISEERRRLPILGIGMLVPGPLDPERKRILTPSGLSEWHGLSVAALERRLGLRITLEKDTTALALAEAAQNPTVKDFLVLHADGGLGAALVSNGELFRSQRGDVAELGHTTLIFGGELCSCGRRGCAERYVSIPRLLSRASALADRSIGWRELLTLAESSPAYANLLSEQSEALGAVCVNAVNLFAPSVIYLEGLLSENADAYAKKIEPMLHTEAFGEHGRDVRLLPSSLSGYSGAAIAAAPAFEKFFQGEWQ